MALLFAGCAHAKGSGSADPDREATPALVEWLRGHEPSRLDVSGIPVEAVRRADPAAFIQIVSEEPRAACRQAARDHALLLIRAHVRQPARRAAALDCGFALFRDDRAVVVAPR